VQRLRGRRRDGKCTCVDVSRWSQWFEGLLIAYSDEMERTLWRRDLKDGGMRGGLREVQSPVKYPRAVSAW
jgi:hypothetical protein